MTELYIILAVVVGVVGLTFLFNYLKRKNIIDENIGDDLANAVNLARLIMEVLPSNEKIDKIKDKSTLIFDIADTVTDYVHDLEIDNSDKNQIALDTALEVLSKMKIEVTDAQKQLIVMAISASLKHHQNKENQQ